VSERKGRKYVASTLFQGRYQKLNNEVGSGNLAVKGKAAAVLSSNPNSNVVDRISSTIKYIEHPLKMLVIQ